MASAILKELRLCCGPGELTAVGKERRGDIELAFKMARPAVELTQETDGFMLDTLALAYWLQGDAAKALEIQTRAVELVGNDERIDDYWRRPVRESLERYRRK